MTPKSWGQPIERSISPPTIPGCYFPKANYLTMLGRPSEGLGAAGAGLAVNPNYVPLLMPRAVAENSLGRYEQAKADAQLAIRLSPRDPWLGPFHGMIGSAELGLGHVDAAIDQFHQEIDWGYRGYQAYAGLAAAYAQAGKMDEAKDALAEARRINPKLTVRWMTKHGPGNPAVLDGLRKAGLPEE